MIRRSAIDWCGISDFSDLANNTTSKSTPTIVAYEKNGLKITFTLEAFPSIPNTTAINVEARNDTVLPMTEFLFQAAVPKASIWLIIDFFF